MLLTSNNLKVIFKKIESILLLRALRAVYKSMIFFISNVQLMRYFAFSVTFLH